MTAIVESGTRIVQVHPLPTEVAIVHVPEGGVAHVHHPSGMRREYSVDVDLPVLVVPGDRETIAWGCVPCRYGSPHELRNGHRPVNRDAWHAATRALHGGAAVVYVQYEARDYYGKPRWTAVSVRLAGKDGQTR